MLQKFYPGEYVDSTYQIDFDKLYKEGYRGVIFDIDNTLVPHGAPADERAIKLFAHLKELGFSCMLLSNNKEPRVKMFNDSVHVNYIYDAHKPSVQNYKKAVEKLDLVPKFEKTFGGSDNNVFALHGIEGLVIATSMNQVHSCQEYTSIPEIRRVAQIVVNLCMI